VITLERGVRNERKEQARLASLKEDVMAWFLGNHGQAQDGLVEVLGNVQISNVDGCLDNAVNFHVGRSQINCVPPSRLSGLQAQVAPHQCRLLLTRYQPIGIRGEHRQAPFIGLPECRTNDSM
jgi:hypothetical protein